MPSGGRVVLDEGVLAWQAAIVSSGGRVLGYGWDSIHQPPNT